MVGIGESEDAKILGLEGPWGVRPDPALSGNVRGERPVKERLASIRERLDKRLEVDQFGLGLRPAPCFTLKPVAKGAGLLIRPCEAADSTSPESAR
ncbi:hypothetical protein NM208_g16205 [Fusarium decemcellulare]|uniref:Uncharacterized protein n=1 Tax=Fusarium decemcellulare TaxID=57161 RepID=A0ACC1RCR1_9HYPO|nr:hypothetical protein NM208_g16205 [Fusarium decemcellulare]